MPDHFTNETSVMEEFIEQLCHYTNLRAQQVKASKPTDYYTSKWTNIECDEMKPFIGIRMIVKHSLTKPRYEDYFSKEATNFVTFTPGFRDVFTRDRFLAIWKFIHIHYTD
ncbi:hypothetical protein SNE40_013576 [Patella caerulea]|uniref:PiggyBac transposable element-derived protein domain-containing protein n=1 Tax=Patella caerulea TaxID=87958 RepID=A0AAN8PQW6_PATCE